MPSSECYLCAWIETKTSVAIAVAQTWCVCAYSEVQDFTWSLYLVSQGSKAVLTNCCTPPCGRLACLQEKYIPYLTDNF